jgi:hypothetical protein
MPEFDCRCEIVGVEGETFYLVEVENMHTAKLRAYLEDPTCNLQVIYMPGYIAMKIPIDSGLVVRDDDER